MQLIDLHRHLDGSMRLSTLQELAQEQGCAFPPMEDIVFHNGMDLQSALGRFAFPLSFLQDAHSLHRVAKEICEDARNHGVGYLELRFAPHLHLQKGMHPQEVIDVVLDAIDDHVHIILCGLYGDDPKILEEYVEMAIPRKRICGIDLAGGPLPTHHHSLKDYRPAFLRAKAHGIGRTVHAGEGRPPQEIATAILALEAQRIGHGTTLLQDPDVFRLIQQRRVCIEACVTSNVHTGVIQTIEEHPIVQWVEHGIPVTICTDNTLLSQVDAPKEYARVSTIPHMTQDYIKMTIESGKEAAFAR